MATLKETTLSGKLNLSTENTLQINFRPGNTSYTTYASYQTTGNEALVFGTKNDVTSFMFINGENDSNIASDRWTKITPALQIKQNKVQINGLWNNGETPDYNFKVNGTSFFNGDFYFYSKAGTNKFWIMRESTGEGVSHYVDDSNYYINYNNDEASANIRWTINNTDTESGGGANASSHYMQFSSSNSGVALYVDGTAVSLSGHTHSYVPLNSKQIITKGDESTTNVTGLIMNASDNSHRAHIGFKGNVGGAGTATKLELSTSYGDIELRPAGNATVSGNQILTTAGGFTLANDITMADSVQFYFKGSGNCGTYLGYRATTPSLDSQSQWMHSKNGYQTKGFYIMTNGYDSSNDYGGLAVDNEGVTVYGAGDSANNFTGVFRVINEDNYGDGAQLLVTKNGGTYIKHGLHVDSINASGVLYGDNDRGLVVQSNTTGSWQEGVRVLEASNHYSVVALTNNNDDTPSYVTAIVSNSSTNQSYIERRYGGSNYVMNIPTKNGTVAIITDYSSGTLSIN